MRNQNREQLVKELALVEAAIMTSFGDETVMLMELQVGLHDRLTEVSARQCNDSDSYRPVAA
jgi:hypothetical protein